MYRKIVVPLDGSTFAERSLALAAEIARANSAEIILVRTVGAAGGPAGSVIDAQAAAVEVAEAYVASVAGRLAEDGLQVQTATPFAHPADGILLEIDLRGADLVVMCTHGRSGLGRWIYGSIAEAVLAKSHAPILLVRPTGALPALASLGRSPLFLVPLDGSTLAERVLPHAVSLASAFAGRIHLLQVVLPPSLREPLLEASIVHSGTATDALFTRDFRTAEGYLAGVAERLMREYVETAQDELRPEYPRGGAAADAQWKFCVDTVVRAGWPPDVILSEAAACGASLIVMATHGRTGLEAVLLGSVALEVIHHTLLPVMLLRRPAA